MQLSKIPYANNGVLNQDITNRFEFFMHYWQFCFVGHKSSFDPYYLKSHRTVVEKVKLQIEGNYESAKKYIEIFLTNEVLFKKSDIIMMSLKGTKEMRAINKIKKYPLKTNSEWRKLNRKGAYEKLTTLNDWLNNSYPLVVTQKLKDILTKQLPMTAEDRDNIKELTNCYIIELYNKGFGESFIKKVPELISNKDKFPYERIAADFENREEYKQYKENAWANMSLEDQIDGILRFTQRTPVSRPVIFRIYDINWRTTPLTFLDVEFYNPTPTFNPKIVHKNSNHFFEETFTLKPEDYEKSSTCNACVTVDGVHEDDYLVKGYKKVKNALDIINMELALNGKAYPTNAFITNPQFDQLWGESEALTRWYKPLDAIEQGQQERLDFFDKLKYPDDKQMIEFACTIFAIIKDRDYYNPEELWITLEAHLGNESAIKQVFKNVYRVFLKYNYTLGWQRFYATTLNFKYSFSHPDQHYELTQADCQKFALIINPDRSENRSFERQTQLIRDTVQNTFISDTLDQVEAYLNDKSNFESKVNRWLEYNLKELYAQRNLTVHKNMSDTMFLLKQRQIKAMMNVFIETLLHNYINENAKSIEEAVKNINRKARRI
ncbi:MAG: hypothetical protein EWV91_13030 [Microcystis aeruginosa Ma_QC_Ca_00000000_S207]|uniref:Uncharacterized protein n=1 Tax=Microcystis aeruginosa Ma_QC_Ca_00000000_S207 TaxID=2486251 RepID=A0A552FHT3_MICAE|nr:MAG: hypothetical protein EWV91_13030 [Microcystis aeruginosa Ma_QC_Ca_00000000_S207]